MNRRIRGMSKLELTFVILAIGLVIAILLPSLPTNSRAPAVVRCASNLKQLYIGMMLYAAQNDDFMLPAILSNGNSSDYRWYGFATLGPLFDPYMGGGAGHDPKVYVPLTQNIIKKMLDCPSVNHPNGWGPIDEGGNGKWGYDYTYNQMLGSNSAAPGAPPDFLYPFAKRSDVRPEVLVASDVRDVTNIHDYVFNGVTPSLVPTSKSNTADYQAIAGTPHKNGTQTNMLFADGQIITDNINKLLGPPPTNWVVNWQIPKVGTNPFE